MNEYQISLPINQPKLRTDDPTLLPDYLLSFAVLNENSDNVIHKTKKGKNLWVPASLYWGDRLYINIPYIPFFSNCKGYGFYIPIWSVTEQNYHCDFIPYEEVVYTNEFLFGSVPVTDSCDFDIECFYDEVIGDRQPLPRWFEVDSGANLFDISIEAVKYEDLMKKEFSNVEILTFQPVNDEFSFGNVP